MLLPVIGFTKGIAYWSLRMVPMLLRLWPSLASLIMKASTSSGWYLHQFGGRLLTGLIEWDFPFSCFGIFVSLEHSKPTVYEYLRVADSRETNISDFEPEFRIFKA